MLDNICLDGYSLLDPKTNPFAPGAGTQPPELAGREPIIADAEVALALIKRGRPAKSQLLLGLRGVGKTVLLNRIAEIAEAQGDQELDRNVLLKTADCWNELSKLAQAADEHEKAKGAQVQSIASIRYFFLRRWILDCLLVRRFRRRAHAPHYDSRRRIDPIGDRSEWLVVAEAVPSMPLVRVIG